MDQDSQGSGAPRALPALSAEGLGPRLQGHRHNRVASPNTIQLCHLREEAEQFWLGTKTWEKAYKHFHSPGGGPDSIL